MTVLIDTSVLLDVIVASKWRWWSEAKLSECADGDDVAINQVIYAELAPAFTSRAALDRRLQGVGLRRLSLPWASSWLASAAFIAYRRTGGVRSAPLPDFFIGAHAQASGLTLLTRDPVRIRTYFPGVALIAPEGDERSGEVHVRDQAQEPRGHSAKPGGDD